ncbi:MAG: hypothetical protein ACYS22_03585 [Planctomycetota bacterium]|jgi:hypothetical protein
MRQTRGRLLGALLATILVTPLGCATIVIGPAEGTDPFPGLTGMLIAQRPVAVPQGPSTGPSATSQSALSGSIRRAIGRTDLEATRFKRVYVAGYHASLLRLDDPKRAKQDASRRTLERYAAAQAAGRVLLYDATVVTDPRKAEVLLIPVVEIAGGSVTERAYRVYGYPVYYHVEDHESSDVTLLIYDLTTSRLIEAVGGRTTRVHVDSYLLDIFGFRFVF